MTSLDHAVETAKQLAVLLREHFYIDGEQPPAGIPGTHEHAELIYYLVMLRRCLPGVRSGREAKIMGKLAAAEWCLSEATGIPQDIMEPLEPQSSRPMEIRWVVPGEAVAALEWAANQAEPQAAPEPLRQSLSEPLPDGEQLKLAIYRRFVELTEAEDHTATEAYGVLADEFCYLPHENRESLITYLRQLKKRGKDKAEKPAST